MRKTDEFPSENLTEIRKALEEHHVRSRKLHYYRCLRHPRYEAKGKPRGLCKACWVLWVELNCES